MSNRHQRLDLWADQQGQTNIEWVLILVGFGIPLVYALRHFVAALVGYYQMMTFLHSMPLP